jgi:hypothetical protein
VDELMIARLLPRPEASGASPVEASGASLADGSPQPRSDEVVVLLPFFIRGLGIPCCDFLRQLLDFYKVELVHLNTNSVLQISVFIDLCEAFLGIPPSLDLFRHLFWVKPQPSAANPAVIGGAGIQLRDNSAYIAVRAKTSNKGWHAQWFYCKNLTPALPLHSGRPPLPNTEWRSLPSEPENSEVRTWKVGIVKLANLGLTGPHVMADWLSCRVQPLKLQPHPAWDYSGPSDSSREDPSDFAEKEVTDMLEAIFASLEGFPGDCRLTSFSFEHPRTEVTR